MASEAGFQLEFKNLTGGVIYVTCTGLTKIKEVKKMIGSESGVPESCIKIMKGRKFLRNEEESLASYGIEGPMKLKIIIRLNQVIPHAEQINHDARIWCVDISPNDKITAVGLVYGHVVTYNTATGERIFYRKEHGGTNVNVRFSNDGNMLISGSTNQCAKIWNHDGHGNLDFVREINVGTNIWTIDWTRDNSQFLVAGYGHLQTYEIENGEQIHQYTGIQAINSSRFSNNGLFIANSGQRGKLIVANTSDGSLMHNLNAHGGLNIWIVAISKNDEFFFSGGHDKTIRQWAVSTGENLKTWTFENQIYGLYMLKNDEFFLGLEGDSGRGSLVKVDGAVDDVDKRTEIFNNNTLTYKIAGSNFKNAFIAYSNNKTLIWHKFSEEEFFGSM